MFTLRKSSSVSNVTTAQVQNLESSPITNHLSWQVIDVDLVHGVLLGLAPRLGLVHV